MKQTGNVILITGGGSGLGRGLAEAFHQAGNRVIITGRRQSVLDDTVRAHPGMKAMRLDVANPADIERFAAVVRVKAPKLNVLINNAGIMKPENLKAGMKDLVVAEQTIATNLLGPLRLTAALLPTLLAQPEATIMTVSSGLAFVPIATNATYCATKAAIHSWTQSLRYQLRDTSVEVLEIAPPYVQTELTGAHQLTDPNAMPLGEFLQETMELLKNPPVSGEILVKRVHPQRFAEHEGKYDELYAQRNEMARQRAAANAPR
jgi:uncharacterized oxidoreductase